MKLAFDEIRPDEYSPAEEPRRLGELLVERVEAHSHLLEASIGFVFRDEEIRRRGRVVAAEAIFVDRILQAERRWSRLVKWALLRILDATELPRFLILIDRNIWSGYSIDEKMALIDHELSHCAQATEDDGETPKFHKETGEPIWTIRGHDLEEFCGVIERNGIWNEDVAAMARAIVDALSREHAAASNVA